MAQDNITPVSLGAVDGAVLPQDVLGGVGGFVREEAAVAADDLHGQRSRFDLAIFPVAEALVGGRALIGIQLSALDSAVVFGVVRRGGGGRRHQRGYDGAVGSEVQQGTEVGIGVLQVPIQVLKAGVDTSVVEIRAESFGMPVTPSPVAARASCGAGAGGGHTRAPPRTQGSEGRERRIEGLETGYAVGDGGNAGQGEVVRGEIMGVWIPVEPASKIPFGT